MPGTFLVEMADAMTSASVLFSSMMNQFPLESGTISSASLRNRDTPGVKSRSFPSGLNQMAVKPCHSRGVSRVSWFVIFHSFLSFGMFWGHVSGDVKFKYARSCFVRLVVHGWVLLQLGLK